jgi:hypothetical protein
MDIRIEIGPDGLGVAPDSAGDDQKAGAPDVIVTMVDAATVGMYHSLNSENTLKPLVMPFTEIEKICCELYRDSMCVEKKEKRLRALPRGCEPKVRLVYQNKARGTKLKVGLVAVDTRGNRDNKGTLALYNTILENIE